MKFLILLGALVCAAWASPLGSILNEEGHALNGDITPQLTFVTTVDGKSYFADAVAPRNWTDASAFCDGLGMHLATITSTAQFAALSSASVPDFPSTFYWLGGRDAENVRQFVWNATDAPLSDSFFPFEKFGDNGYLNCIFLDKWSGAGSHLSFWPCSKTAAVLCET